MQDAAWVEQFDTHAADDASASRSLSARWCPPAANAVPINASMKAVIKVSFIRASPYLHRQHVLAQIICMNQSWQDPECGATFLAASSASAQAPTPKPVRPPPIASAYCVPVSAGFLEADTKTSEEMRKCSRGDAVVILAKSAGAVARMCDQAVVSLGENVVCMLVFRKRATLSWVVPARRME